MLNECVKSLSRGRLFETPWTVAHQAPLSMGIWLSTLSEFTSLSMDLRSFITYSLANFSDSIDSIYTGQFLLHKHVIPLLMFPIWNILSPAPPGNYSAQIACHLLYLHNQNWESVLHTSHRTCHSTQIIKPLAGIVSYLSCYPQSLAQCLTQNRRTIN